MDVPENPASVSVEQSSFAPDQALEDLAQAARAVEEAREHERQALARELHDRVVQPLVALASAVEALPMQLPDIDLLASWSQTAQRLAREALGALRDVVAGLHTHPYEIQALPSALRQYLAPLFQARGMRVTVEAQDWPEYLPPEWAFHLYLAVREATVNAERHGHASEARVLLRADADDLHLVIDDNGVGFQVSGTSSPKTEPAGSGLGIANMRERAHLLGGKLTLGASPSKGVRVSITVPRAPLASTTPGSRATSPAG